MFDSPEFWSPDAQRAKVKTPLEFVASAVRASGADVADPLPLAMALDRMGMPLYRAQPPTGYSMKADAWVNSAALLNRLNFALGLASGKVPGAKVDSQRVLEPVVAKKNVSMEAVALPTDPDNALALLEEALLAGKVSAQTHDSIRKQLTATAANKGQTFVLAEGLLLGSPEFQRR
jgi:uncharacterized protein (DUF1800 family)